MLYAFFARRIPSTCFLLIVSFASVRAFGQATIEFERRFLQQAESGQREVSDHLLGPVLHGRNGIVADYVYTGEVFSNMRGGLNTNNATQYKGNFDLFLTANLNEMGIAPGGLLYLYGNDGHGRGITEEFVGDYQGISNIDSLDTMQMTEFWWERAVFGEFLRVRLGKQDSNHDFAVVEMAGDFISGSYGQHPNIPMPAWPDGAMGVAAFFQLTDLLEFRAGLYDGVGDGRTWGFSGTGETFSVYEFKMRYDVNGTLHGEFHIGMWYHSGQFGGLGGSPVHAGCHGLYMGVEQMIVKENPSDDEDEQGLGVFAQYGWGSSCASP